MLFTIYIDINDHRIGEQCIVPWRFSTSWTTLKTSTLSCCKTRQLRQAHVSCNPANISVVLSHYICSVVVSPCEYISICILYYCLPDILLLSAPNLPVCLGKKLALKLSLVTVCFYWLHCAVKVFPWAATHLKQSLWKPWGLVGSIFFFFFPVVHCCLSWQGRKLCMCARSHFSMCFFLSGYCRHLTSLYQPPCLQILQWQISKE